MTQANSMIKALTGRITVALCLCISASAMAEDEAALPAELQKLYDCRALLDTAAKAGCYDAALDAFEAARSSGEIATVTRKEIEEVKRETFGFGGASLAKLGSVIGLGKKDGSSKKTQDAVADMLISPITKVSSSARGSLIFKLENGHVWRQLDSDDSIMTEKRARRTEPRIAHIERAVLGTYRLKINGKGPRVKVRRVE